MSEQLTSARTNESGVSGSYTVYFARACQCLTIGAVGTSNMLRNVMLPAWPPPPTVNWEPQVAVLYSVLSPC
ncbi:hypothetical protein ACIF83_25220 [Streptomyces sp. NPDC085866]|uniref:hypothetical protein n=1 Tax=Streptomyces sp. NPDC085866 TaxID=3365736 RepID=UPI0037D61044